MQGLLELLDVPYVGSGVLASALCMDKVVFKDVMGRAGLPQVRLLVARRRRGRGAGRSVGGELPVLGQAGAAGVVGRDRARRRAPDELEAAIEAAAAHDPRVIVEAQRARHRGRVLGARAHRRAAGQPARRDPARRRRGRLVRLRGQVHARRHGARGAGADPRRRARAGARAGRRPPSAWPAAAGWRARTSSSTATTSCSTSSTPCPASRRRASTASSGTTAGSPYPELCDRLVRIAIERFERERLRLF